ncbi:HEAT repeat domain-containing protein [Xanthocytophaga flava]|uniref:HEAT repeat domain-containing protein n=1 Tax=Xanthocytophaga flava TaxID=3048013 RepID=UPI0028D8C742|nr:hypothetical protein [Xanthocytophaga flavus]MDJ1473667.1 hypothetical protein [Xanthocytophaga flavus]
MIRKKPLLLLSVVLLLLALLYIKYKYDKVTATSFFHGDGWTDAEWEEMIEKSDLILLGEVQEDGTWHTRVEAVEVLKGKLDQKDIWITGYNDPYGSPESVEYRALNSGKRYILFLQKLEETNGRIRYLEEQAGWNLFMRRFVNAVKDKTAYTVWSPTSGMIAVENDSAYYNLFGFPGYKTAKPYPDFLEFLKEAITYKSIHQPNPVYLNKVLDLLNSSLEHKPTPCTPDEYLMRLDMCGNQKFYPVFHKALLDTFPDTRYALGLHLRKLERDSVVTLFERLLVDTVPIIQELALEELLHREDSSRLGILLLSRLDSASNIVIQPNIMEPRGDAFASSGVKAKIISTLAKLNYHPAIPKLTSFLHSNDEGLFVAAIHALYDLGEPHLDVAMNNYLQKGNVKDMTTICSTIKNCELKKSYKGLLYFIEAYRDKYPNTSFAVDCLSEFDKKDVEVPLISGLNKLTTQWDTIDFQYTLIRDYIETLTKLKSKNAQGSIRRTFYFYYGLDSNYSKNNQLFTIKRQLEKKLEDSISNFLEERNYELAGIKAVVRILNTSELMQKRLAKPRYEYVLGVNMKYDFTKTRKKINDEDFGDREDAALIDSVQNLLSTYLKIPSYCIYVRKGSEVTMFNDRFKQGSNFNDPIVMNYWTLLENYANYVTAVPNQTDLSILKTIQQNNFINSVNSRDTYIERESLKSKIKEIEKAL